MNRPRLLVALIVLGPAALTTPAQAADPPAAGQALPPIVAAPDLGRASASAGVNVFPVFGSNPSYTDDYAAPRAGTGWHHGTDIFAPTGTPVLAVADGELYKVGVNTLGGNRLWLRDGAGNTYYYAHLSAYAANVADGTRVRAGQVIAFVGNTGQAITTPPHLHFEIHPGDGASINPYPYLRAWQKNAPISKGFVPTELPAAPAAGDAATSDGPAGALVLEVTPPAPLPAPHPESTDGVAVAVS